MPIAALLETLVATQRLIVRELQAEYYCDDVEPPPEAFGWSESELRKFMEAGGGTKPRAAGNAATPEEDDTATVSTKQVPSTWGWGMFCSPLASEYSRTVPSTLPVMAGKVPVASKGPIVWLAGAPDAEAVAALCGRTSAVIPIGSATSNAYAVEIDGEASVQKAVEGLLATQCQNGFKWVAPRDLIVLPSMRRATPSEAEAVIRAISLLAWHKAHAFNGADGEPTAFAPDTLGRRRKLTTSGRSMYPRVDPVAIVLVVSSDGERILLGRQKNFPPNMFTCVSGFVEHGESVECGMHDRSWDELVVRPPDPCRPELSAGSIPASTDGQRHARHSRRHTSTWAPQSWLLRSRGRAGVAHRARSC